MTDWDEALQELTADYGRIGIKFKADPETGTEIVIHWDAKLTDLVLENGRVPPRMEHDHEAQRAIVLALMLDYTVQDILRRYDIESKSRWIDHGGCE